MLPGKWNKLLIYLCIMLFIAGGVACGQAAPTNLPAPTISVYLTPYWTRTPSPTSPGIPTPPSIPVSPQPSATPFLHTITNEDTLLALAFRYGVSLQEILAANPGINPNILSVGKKIVIPIKGQEPTTIPTSAPVQVKMTEPVCYPTVDGGAWCFVGIQNQRSKALENLTASIGLFSIDGKNVASQEAIAPLNYLPSGKSIPLAVFINPPLPVKFTAHAKLLTALEVDPKDPRYLAATAQVDRLEIDPSGKQATIQGKVVLPKKTDQVHTAWVAAIAYGENGEIVGLRKWEACPSGLTTPAATPAQSPTPKPGLTSKCLSFNINIFTLGPDIQRVEVLAEARP